MKEKIFFLLIYVCFVFSVQAQQSKFVETEKAKLHYLEFGKGVETIVLIHGMSDTADIWKKFVRLISKDFRVIAFDRRGVGKSQRTKSGYNLATFADDIKLLIDNLQLKTVHLVGHSFGGSIAMTFAANYHDKLKTLTLIEGGFWEKPEKTPEIPKCPDPIEQNCLISNEILSESYKYDPEPLFAKVSVPTLFVMGIPNFSRQPMSEADRLKIEKEFGKVAAKIKSTAETKLKKGNFVLIKKAEHWVFNDQPRITAAKILSFIKANQSNK